MQQNLEIIINKITDDPVSPSMMNICSRGLPYFRSPRRTRRFSLRRVIVYRLIMYIAEAVIP